MQRRGLREQSTIALLLGFDLIWGLSSYALAFLCRVYFPVPFTANLLPAGRVFELHHMLGEILLAELVILYVFGFYDLRALRVGFRAVVNSFTALFVHLLASTSLYFFAGDLFFPRSVLVLFWLLNAVGVATSREWIGRRLAATSPIRVLLVGTVTEVEQFLGGVGEPRLHHVDIVGIVAVGADGIPPPSPTGPPWLGTIAELPQLLTKHDVGEVILLSPFSWRDQLVNRLLREGQRPRVSVVPSIYDILVGRISSGRIHDVPLVEVVKNPRDDLAYLIKRLSDFVIAGVLFVVTLPVALAAAVAVRVSSPGPVLYQQRRVGQGGA